MPPAPPPPVPFGANAIRLSARQWLCAAALALAVCLGLPALWPKLEPFEPGPDYRVPYALSNDYQHFARYCGEVTAEDAVLVVGDSVVWGEYVAPEDALSQCLSDTVDGQRFVNLGVNGIHPAALWGLLKYYGKALSGQRVLLHYNPLWMSSKRHDLQSEKETRFNHPQLIPQFRPKIPCYKASRAERLGVVAGHLLPFRAWTEHIAITYLDNTTPALWAVENPYANPLRAITLELPQPETQLRHQPVPWQERGIKATNFDWVPLDKSLQWELFKRTVRLLQSRDCQLFILAGPFNEPMLAPESAKTYAEIRTGISTWLSTESIPHLTAKALPTELYADASHPLAEGYQRLAAQLQTAPGFTAFAKPPTTN